MSSTGARDLNPISKRLGERSLSSCGESQFREDHIELLRVLHQASDIPAPLKN